MSLRIQFNDHLFCKTVKFFWVISLSIIIIVLSGCNIQLASKLDISDSANTIKMKRHQTEQTAISSITNSHNGQNDIHAEVLVEGETSLSTQIDQSTSLTYINLDKGETGIGDSLESDIVFWGAGGSSFFYVILPVNGAKKYKSDTDVETFMDCYQKLDNFGRGSIPDFEDGKAICVKTNENRLAVIKYKVGTFQLDEAQDIATITISYTIWDQIVP